MGAQARRPAFHSFPSDLIPSKEFQGDGGAGFGVGECINSVYIASIQLTVVTSMEFTSIYFNTNQSEMPYRGAM